MFDFLKNKKGTPTSQIKPIGERKYLSCPFTLAGVTFDNRQELIKHLGAREELTIIKYNYEGEDAFKVLNKNNAQIGSIRKSDIPKLNEIYDNITKVNVLGTSHFKNEDGNNVFSCQVGVTYYE